MILHERDSFSKHRRCFRSASRASRGLHNKFRTTIESHWMNEMSKQKPFMLKLNMISLSLPSIPHYLAPRPHGTVVCHSLISFCCGGALRPHRKRPNLTKKHSRSVRKLKANYQRERVGKGLRASSSRWVRDLPCQNKRLVIDGEAFRIFLYPF